MSEIHTHKLVLHIAGSIAPISGITATAGRANDFALTHEACKLLLYCWGNAEDNINNKKDSWLVGTERHEVCSSLRTRCEHVFRSRSPCDSGINVVWSVFACMELTGI